MTFSAGDWVTFRRYWYGRDGLGDSLVPIETLTGKIIEELPDGGFTVERWELAKITRNATVFGNRVDRTPYRIVTLHRLPSLYYRDMRPMPAAMVPGQESKLARIMRYPTKVERDLARVKRKVARR